jgi:hypothetical protein
MVEIDSDCIGRCKFNYRTMATHFFGNIVFTDITSLAPSHLIEMPISSWNISGHVNVCQAVL